MKPDEALRDLIEVIQFTENVSTKIHGLMDEAEIYRTVKEEFVKSKRYNTTIMFLTGDGSKLRMGETSTRPKGMKIAEKLTGLQREKYSIDLKKSRIYSQVVREGKTIEANVGDIMGELFPRPLANPLSKVLGLEKTVSILTPLKQHGKIIGVLGVDSIALVEHFIPSVRNLAQHISTALELAEAHTLRKQMEGKLKSYSEHLEKMVEEKTGNLRESEERLKILFEFAPDAYYLSALKGNFVEGNKAAEEITGYKREELIGKSFLKLKLLPPRQIPKAAMLLAKNALGQPTGPDEFILNRKDGSQVAVGIRTFPVNIKGQTLVLGIARNITERKKAEEALRESEEKYRNLVERANDGVTIIQGMLIKYANPRLVEMTGYTLKEVIGTPFTDYIHPDVLPKVVDHYKRRVAGENVPSIYEAALRSKNNSKIDIEINAGIITYQGKPADLVFIRDITERKKVEAEKLAVMGKVARSIGHDIRNPLQAMRNAAYLLRQGADEERRQKMLKLIDRNIVAADRIIRNLMDFAMASPLALGEEDVNRLLQATLADTVLPEGVKLATRYSDLPHAKVDREQLRRVFQNLTANAVQAMPEGGELNISTGMSGNYIEMKFKDIGIGISKGNLEKVFDPFYTTKAKGTGLGLSNAKRVVEAHQGTITVESEEGKGTVVTVRLPITPNE